MHPEFFPLRNNLQRGAELLPISFGEPKHVFAPAAVLKVDGERPLDESRARDISRVLGRRQLFKQLPRDDDIAGAHARHQKLGKAFDVDHPPGPVVPLDGVQPFPAEVQVREQVVLQDVKIVFFRKGKKPFPLFRRQAHPGRRLINRHGVQQARLVAFRIIFGDVEVEAVLLHGHADDFCAVHGKRRSSPDIRGHLGKHRVAGADQRFGNQIQRLLRAGGDQNVVRPAADAVLLAGKGGEDFPKGAVPFAFLIGKGVSPVRIQHLIDGAFEFLDREYLRHRGISCQVDHVFLARQLPAAELGVFQEQGVRLVRLFQGNRPRQGVGAAARLGVDVPFFLQKTIGGDHGGVVDAERPGHFPHGGQPFPALCG